MVFLATKSNPPTRRISAWRLPGTSRISAGARDEFSGRSGCRPGPTPCETCQEKNGLRVLGKVHLQNMIHVGISCYIMVHRSLDQQLTTLPVLPCPSRLCDGTVAAGTATVKGDKPLWSAGSMPSTATRHRITPQRPVRVGFPQWGHGKAFYTQNGCKTLTMEISHA